MKVIAIIVSVVAAATVRISADVKSIVLKEPYEFAQAQLNRQKDCHEEDEWAPGDHDDEVKPPRCHNCNGDCFD